MKNMLVFIILVNLTEYLESTSPDYQQQAFLKASNLDVGDWFGISSVAISGDTLVVATPHEDSNAIGVNGDESNNDALSSGAVYVFTRAAGVWSQQAYLKASNTEASDSFGNSVAISGDTLIVGASDEDSSATGVGGDESNNNALSSGAAYVFTRSAGVWSQQAYLKASNTEMSDSFGSSVAISGNRVVVGAHAEDSDATGVGGDESNNNADQSGAAYVFSRNAGVWSQEAYLKASNSDAFDSFGFDVAISGQTIVVGAIGEESISMGVNGNENNNDASGSGAAYIFKYSTGNWQQQAYIKASNPDESDWFGFDIDLDNSETTLVIGAFREDSNSSGVNADGTNNDAADSGAAYVFNLDSGNWSQQAYLKASNTDIDDSFGKSVSISDNTIVIGAEDEDSNATGVNGDDSNNDISDTGATYVFTRSAGAWQQQHYLKSEHPEVAYHFGGKVDVSGNTLVISENNEGFIVSASGAAYVFSQPHSYNLNVAVTGLLSAGLVLQNNGTDNLSVLTNGISQFTTQLADDSIYQVVITNQPNNNNHTCIIDGNSQGVIASTNILIKVRCADFIFVDDFE